MPARLLKLIEPKGQFHMQVPQPMHSPSSWKTVPSASFFIAPVGQTSVQRGCSQWLHAPEMGNSCPSTGFFSRPTRRKNTSVARWRASLQAIWHAPQPRHVSRLT
jgi:hypothetical protein